jgi:hypothetical protein
MRRSGSGTEFYNQGHLVAFLPLGKNERSLKSSCAADFTCRNRELEFEGPNEGE